MYSTDSQVNSNKDAKHRYLKYKNKYLKFKLNGGQPESDCCIYFCFDRDITNNALKLLKPYNSYNINDINKFLNLFAYKNNFNTEIDLVYDSININKPTHFPLKIFINKPLNKMDSTISLLHFINKLNKKINSTNPIKNDIVPSPTPKIEPAVVSSPKAETVVAPTTKTETDTASVVSSPTAETDTASEIKITDALIFCKKDKNYSLIRHYTVENIDGIETLVDKDISSISDEIEIQEDGMAPIPKIKKKFSFVFH